MSKETEPIVENTDQTNSEQEMDSQNDEIIVIKENKSRPNDESNDLNLDKINDLLTEERNNSNNESIDAQNGSSQSERNYLLIIYLINN
jgi:precorrin-2 methylase